MTTPQVHALIAPVLWRQSNEMTNALFLMSQNIKNSCLDWFLHEPDTYVPGITLDTLAYGMEVSFSTLDRLDHLTFAQRSAIQDWFFDSIPAQEQFIYQEPALVSTIVQCALFHQVRYL